MSQSGLQRLRTLVGTRYLQLRHQVALRIGGAHELAGDALHEAYLRLAQRDDLDKIKHAQAYLLNTAVYVAIDQIRRDSRHAQEHEQLDAIPDELADPARRIEGRLRLDDMQAIMARLPKRQRELLIEARVHQTPRRELAQRWNISEVMVGKEIRAAHLYCMRSLRELEASTPATKVYEE